VNWQIHLVDKTVAFAEHQHTEQHKPVVISPSARWYNIDDLVAVAVAEPQPLVLGTRQFPLVRDALYFGPSHGGGAVVYSGVESGRMPQLADEVAMIGGLPDGWQGLQAQAPEGYRVYALARFGGQAARHEFEAAAPEGAPVFSVPTQITPEGRARAVFHLPKEFDTWSEETHFFITAAEGAPVSAQGSHHRLELTAGGGPAKVTVRFLGAATSERLRLTGAAGTPETIDAASFTTVGLTLELPADKAVYLSVEGAKNADQTGPFVEITDPVFRGPNQPAMWRPIVGRHKFEAVAADRSGVAKVEFYLNDGRRIGVDDVAPYEVEHQVKDSFCQVVYAVAYDTLGNRRQSFEVPFGDGRVAAKGANGQ
jgi:hypothetical protein